MTKEIMMKRIKGGIKSIKNGGKENLKYTGITIGIYLAACAVFDFIIGFKYYDLQ